MRRMFANLAAMGIAGGMVLSAAGARTVSENLTLTRDTDWSADVVTVANGVTIDLNGHVLKVAGLDGATAASGVVTSSNGGELRFVIPAGTPSAGCRRRTGICSATRWVSPTRRRARWASSSRSATA